MIKDQTRTTFVAVCIAEYLSISETSRYDFALDDDDSLIIRLLSQLTVQKISYSHVVVNQLITESPTAKELLLIEEFLSQEHGNVSARILDKLKHATVAAYARSNIQKKYLNMLVEAPEARNVEIIEIPLFNSEVTGVEALRKFSKFLTKSAMAEDEEKVDL
jgi:arsenite-transporting ATPase